MNDGSGSLSSVSGSPFITGNSPRAVLIHPSKKFVFVANSLDNTISLFTVGASGALTEVTPRTPTVNSPGVLATDSAGNFLYVANTVANSISVYAVDSATGALAEIAGSPFPS